MSAFFSIADVQEQRFRLSPNVRFRPEADIGLSVASLPPEAFGGRFECLLSAKSGHWLTVNATSKPPHLGAGRAYLEDVTAAEFCEEGGHRTLLVVPKVVEQCAELGFIQYGITPRVRCELSQCRQVG